MFAGLNQRCRRYGVGIAAVVVGVVTVVVVIVVVGAAVAASVVSELVPFSPAP